MSEIEWNPAASRDFLKITDYIAEHNPPAAVKIAENILRTIELLRSHPEMARPGRSPGTREMIIGDYIAVYKLDKTRNVEIVRLLHGSQKWP